MTCGSSVETFRPPPTATPGRCRTSEPGSTRGNQPGRAKPVPASACWGAPSRVGGKEAAHERNGAAGLPAGRDRGPDALGRLATAVATSPAADLRVAVGARSRVARPAIDGRRAPAVRTVVAVSGIQLKNGLAPGVVNYQDPLTVALALQHVGGAAALFERRSVGKS